MNENGNKKLGQAYEGLEHETPDKISRMIR
jgi:hypothetical protein